MADSSNPEGPSGELTSGSPDSKTLPCGYEFMRHDIPLGENDCKVKSIPRIDLVHVAVLTPKEGLHPPAYLFDDDKNPKREMIFRPNLKRLLLCAFPLDSIDVQATNLLVELDAARKDDKPASHLVEEERAVIFVAYELGAIVLKRALTIAAASGGRFVEVLENTAAAVFSGCFQKSTYTETMESKMTRFLATRNEFIGDHLNAFSMRCLAEAAQEATVAYIGSMASLQVRAISLYAGEGRQGGKIDAVFDRYIATLGVPFEVCIEEETGDGGSPKFPALHDFGFLTLWAWVPRRQRASTTRTFLSLCAPLRPLQPESFLSAPPEVLRVPTYRNWLNSTGPSILHVDGDYISARQLAEQLFLTHLRGLQKKSDMEKYYRSHAFTFDSADPRRSSVASMIASLLARLYASRCLDKRASQELKNLLHLKNIWNDRFAIAVLDNLRAHFSGPDILFLLQDCDECDSQSWKLFLDYLSGWMERGENGLKIIVTSRKHESLSEAPGWSQILADQSNGSKSLPLPFPRRMSSLMNIVSFGRDAVDIRTKMLKLIREMGKADFCAMMHRFQESVIWHSDSMSNALARLQKLQDAMGPKKSPSETLEDMMRSTVPTDVLRWIISWLLCGVRPLSKRQLIILSILQSHRRESKPSEGTIPYITIAEFNLTWDKLSTWLPTLATYDGSRVFVREEIRDLLKPDTENKPCLWSEVIATAHEELAKFCLQYVCGRRAKTDMRNIFNDYETVDSDHPESSPTETADWNITSLIVQSLPHHLSRCRPDYSNSLLQPILRDSRAKRLTRWARAFWAMRAPLTRPLVAPESAIPVLVEFGLLSEDDVLGLSGELRTQCLVAAAEGGRDDMVTALLDEKTTQGQDLMDTFYAAVRAGNERMALDVGNHIVVSCNGHAEVTYAWPPLSIWSATILGMSGVLGMLLDNGVQPDAAEGLGQTPSPLSMACFLGNHSTTKTLLEHGASASTTDPEGLDCLMAAVASGVVDVVKELLGWDKARLQVKNPHTPLTAAATGGCWKVIQYLLCLGSDPNQTMEGKEFSSRIRTPLAIACANGYVKTTRVLLGARTAGPNTMLPSTISMALYGAAAVGQNPECVRCLLECGADPNHEGLPPLLLEVIRYAKGDGAAAIEIFDMFLGNDPPLDMSETNSRDGETALMRACARGRLALVRWLLERGVDINAVDTRNRSALTHAARSGLVKIVRELLSYKPVLKMDLGSDDIDSLLVATLDYPEILEAVLEGERIPERKPSEFPSALHRAIFYEKLPAARILINKGFDVNTVDDRNMAPIHYAVAFAADASITRLLIDTGADLKVANVEGYTALHLAVCGPTVVMQVLLEYAKHLDLNQRNNKGITPLMMVEKATNNECMKLLIRAGADVNCQNDEGVPPLYLALSFDNRGYVDLLLAQPEIDVNLFSDTRGGPLHRACYNLGVDDVQRLVKRGAVVNLVSKRSVNITTPLITTIITSTLHRRATREWDAPRVERIVRMLVDNGADVRLCTQHGIFESPFSAACFAATPSIISFLLEHGPHMQGHPATGRMPIHLAAANGPEVFQAILPLHVGDLTVVDNEGKSCLHWAAQFGNAQTLSLILSKLESFERIAEVSRPDRDGWTPLCWAARAYAEGGAFSSAARSEKPDFAATICSLLDHGASREVRCRWGEETLSPLELAEGYGAEEEIVRMLGKLISISDESNLSRSKEEVDDKNEAPRRFAETSKQCFYCFLSIRGPGYTCQDCGAMYLLCTKCSSHLTSCGTEVIGDAHEHKFVKDSKYEKMYEDTPKAPAAPNEVGETDAREQV